MTLIQLTSQASSAIDPEHYRDTPHISTHPSPWSRLPAKKPTASRLKTSPVDTGKTSRSWVPGRCYVEMWVYRKAARSPSARRYLPIPSLQPVDHSLTTQLSNLRAFSSILLTSSMPSRPATQRITSKQPMRFAITFTRPARSFDFGLRSRTRC